MHATFTSSCTEEDHSYSFCLWNLPIRHGMCKWLEECCAAYALCLPRAKQHMAISLNGKLCNYDLGSRSAGGMYKLFVFCLNCFCWATANSILSSFLRQVCDMAIGGLAVSTFDIKVNHGQHVEGVLDAVLMFWFEHNYTDCLGVDDFPGEQIKHKITNKWLHEQTAPQLLAVLP